MKIEFSLLSGLSCLLLLFFAFQGEAPELYSVEIGCEVSDEAINITIDPIFLVWTHCATDLSYLAMKGKHAFALGNVIACRNRHRDDQLIDLALQHEATHIAQQRALGIFCPLGYLCGLNMEGEPYYSMPCPDNNRAMVLEKCVWAMWAPPAKWHNQWSFIALTFPLSVPIH